MTTEELKSLFIKYRQHVKAYPQYVKANPGWVAEIAECEQAIIKAFQELQKELNFFRNIHPTEDQLRRKLDAAKRRRGYRSNKERHKLREQIAKLEAELAAKEQLYEEAEAIVALSRGDYSANLGGSETKGDKVVHNLRNCWCGKKHEGGGYK